MTVIFLYVKLDLIRMVAKLQSKELFCKKNARAFAFCNPLLLFVLGGFKMCLFIFV